jgi:DNA-directed RNA polymerase specialized sigma24 family protein
MWSEPGNTSRGINWMLQNGQVSDEDLAHVLIDEYFENLHRLAFWLTRDEKRAGEIARKSIVAAVKERHRFWNQSTLHAWLLSLVYKFADSDRKKWGRKIKGVTEQIEPDTDPDNSLQVYLWLHLEEGLSPAEIAFVFGVTESQVKNSLELAYFEVKTAVEAPGHSSEDHGHIRSLLYTQRIDGLSEEESSQLGRGLESCDSCSRYATMLEEEEAHWLARQPRPVDITAGELERVYQWVQLALSREYSQTWNKLPLKEFLLVGILTIVLFIFGLNMGVFDSFDSRPPLTPIPSPVSMPTLAPRLIFEVGEEEYHFFYSYDRDNETVEQIADLAGISVNALEYINLGINFGSQSTIRLIGFQTDDRFHPEPAPVHVQSSSPITALSSPEDVLSWAAQKNFSGLSHMTASLYIEYGNYGFSGGPAVYLSLVAESGPSHWVLLRESYPQKNTLSLVRADDMLFSKSDQREWFGTIAGKAHADLRETFTVGLNLPHSGSLEVIKDGIVAGRTSVLLERTHNTQEEQLQERFWVDAVTGQVLRYELYGGPEGENPMAVYLVTTVFLNDEMPDWLFYPGAYEGVSLGSLGFWNGIDELVAALLRNGPRSAN